MCYGILSETSFFCFNLDLIIIVEVWRIKSLCYKLLLGIIGISGLLGFMCYLQLHTNDGLAFYHIQNAWRHGEELSWVHNPLWSLYMTMVRSNGMDKLLFVLSIPILWKFLGLKQFREAIWLGMLLVATFASKSLGSYTRFFFACYPVYMYLGYYAASLRVRAIIVVGLFIFLHSLYLLFWFQQSGSAW